MKKNHVLSFLSPLRHLGPLFYILVIIWLDSKVTASIITPVFGVIGLAYMALSFTPQRMLFWAIIYSIIIASIFLISPLDYLLNIHQNIDPITAWVRTLSFVITSLLAFKYCNSLHELRTMNKEQEEVLNAMMEPIITSDIDGKIRFMNQSARELLLEVGEVGEVGESFFDNFFPKKTMGASISNYLKQFDSQQNHVPLNLEIASKKHSTETRLLSSGGGKILVTIINKKASSEFNA